MLQAQQRARAQEALSEFYARATSAQDPGFAAFAASVIKDADSSLWSKERLDTYERSASGGSALAVLRIARLSLEAPVFEGALDWELDRGPGWIRGTALISSGGNVGIAGHRDGFFRRLRDIETGDIIELQSPTGLTRYRVSDTSIVTPDAVHVLDPTAEEALTLVTCYPFYFVGHAPQRFIVRAVAESL